MDTWVWILIGVIVAVVVFGALGTRRARSLQDQFGREYDRNDDGEAASTRDREAGEVRAHDNVERLR